MHVTCGYCGSSDLVNQLLSLCVSHLYGDGRVVTLSRDYHHKIATPGIVLTYHPFTWEYFIITILVSISVEMSIFTFCHNTTKINIIARCYCTMACFKSTFQVLAVHNWCIGECASGLRMYSLNTWPLAIYQTLSFSNSSNSKVFIRC